MDILLRTVADACIIGNGCSEKGQIAPDDTHWWSFHPPLNLTGACLAATVFLVLSSGAHSAQLANGAASVPPALRIAAYRQLEHDAGSAYHIGRHGCLVLPNAEVRGCFDAAGARFQVGPSRVSLHLAAYGRAGVMQTLKPVDPHVSGNRIRYRYGGITEWWRASPAGFEQGFIVSSRPQRGGPLELRLTSNRIPGHSGEDLTFGRLRYGRVAAFDAAGRPLHTILKSTGHQLLIVVNDARSRYPITVDPLVWIEQEITASDGAAQDHLGLGTIAISGSTALVGAPEADVGGNVNQGAAYLFTETNGVWSEKQKLTAPDGAANDLFGVGVSLVGGVAVIGAIQADVGSNPNEGAAYVFTDSNGTWTETQKLTPSPAVSDLYFGAPTAVNGNNILIGSGASAYLFTNTGGVWSQTQELTASDGADFAWSAALSTNTAVLGSGDQTVGGNSYQGAAYIFTLSGGTWTQTQRITPSDGVQNACFGFATAIESTTIVVSAPYYCNGNGPGSVYVFKDTGGIWTQAQEITPNGGGSSDDFGFSIALSGNTMLIGAIGTTVGGNSRQGATYVFNKSGSLWSQTQKLTAINGTVGENFGWSASFDGHTALIGAPFASPNGNTGQGAAYVLGNSDLGLTVSAPTTTPPASTYVSQAIVSNASTFASPAVALTFPIPVGATFVNTNATQGNCSETSGLVSCSFGSIAANSGMATANVTLRVNGVAGNSIDNNASLVHSIPAVTATSTVRLDDPPVAMNGSITTNEGISVSGTLNASDADGNALTYNMINAPSHGSVDITDASTGAFTYRPNSGYSGSDTFTFHASDGIVESNAATESVTVKATTGGGSGGGGSNGGGGALGPISFLCLLVLSLVLQVTRGVRHSMEVT